MKKYNEIFELKTMLENNNIPFEFEELKSSYKNGYLLSYPKYDEPTENSECVCSVAEHSFSYGHNEDKLEIMGLLTEEEKEADTGDCFSVAGYLTATDVFIRIKNHYLQNKIDN